MEKRFHLSFQMLSKSKASSRFYRRTELLVQQRSVIEHINAIKELEAVAMGTSPDLLTQFTE